MADFKNMVNSALITGTNGDDSIYSKGDSCTINALS